MSCRGVRGRLSAFLDSELPAHERRAVAAHLDGCAACAREARALRRVGELLGELPRVQPAESLAARVLDRLEVESRGPGLALLFRPAWKARPLMLPSLVPAALVVVTVVAAALGLSSRPAPGRPSTLSGSWNGRLPASGTEGNPLFPSSGVSVPRARGRGLGDELLAQMGEGTLFVETIVARDGSVSAVRLLGGDSEQAGPLLEALRRERFEPGRYRGRPVAVSLYRLISRMDVRPPRV